MFVERQKGIKMEREKFTKDGKKRGEGEGDENAIRGRL